LLLARGVASRNSIDPSPKVYGQINGMFDAIALFIRNPYTVYNALRIPTTCLCSHLYIVIRSSTLIVRFKGKDDSAINRITFATLVELSLYAM
jgi:hypothetical protein